MNTITHQWVDISNGLPTYIKIDHLEIIPGLEDALYAGTNYGLYYYNVTEGIWQFVEGNLPNVRITDIQIDMKNKRIVVGTFGRGVWQAGLPCMPDNNETIYITSDQTWQLDRFINGTLSIEENYTLTLENLNVWMNEGAKIIVKPGAKLIVDGGAFRSICSEPWDGIEVWGNPNAHQYPDAYGNYQQGYLELKNNAIIEFSHASGGSP